jgi:hypothetical protein
MLTSSVIVGATKSPETPFIDGDACHLPRGGAAGYRVADAL